MIGSIALDAIAAKREALKELELKIWNTPEIAYLEVEACKWTAEMLKNEGFDVEIGVGGVPTAIKATYGSGHPVIGLLGEYDALPGMSQKVQTEKEAVEAGCPGQGCGHNLLGVAHVGAAIGIKAEMIEKKLPGTIIYFGCPGEEQLTGKPFMARGGAFDGIDMCIAWHPSNGDRISIGTQTALNTAKFHFKGRTAHAGGDPHNGRSALDAVELMNVGANYLREHVTSDVRIHYTLTEGGTAPNIVPDKACVWYYVRAMRREAVEDVYARLVKVAKGAAMMTETEVEIEFLGGCYNTLNNKVLANLVKDTMHEIPQEPWTDEEIAFAKALNEQSPQYKAGCAAVNRPEGTQLYEGPMEIETANSYGSTDVGDVQHIVPGIMIRTATYNIGAPGHSWQITACSGMSIGEKGMNRAAQVMAVSALKVLNDTSIYEAAKAEFDQEMAGKKYVCPIPAEVPVPYTK